MISGSVMSSSCVSVLLPVELMFSEKSTENKLHVAVKPAAGHDPLFQRISIRFILMLSSHLSFNVSQEVSSPTFFMYSLSLVSS